MTLATLFSRTPQGLEAPLVRVEVDVGAGLPSFSCIPTGMPRPSSTTVTELSGWIETSTREQWPASASSTELSTTS